MFDSVLEQNIPRRQIGRGASFSLGVHALLVALVVYLSSRPQRQVEKDLRAIAFLSPPPPPPPPPPSLPGGEGEPRTKVQHKVIRKPDTLIETTKKVAEAETPKPEKTAAPEPGGQVGGVAGGVPGGVVGGVTGGVVGGQVGGTGAIPFGPGMGDRPAPVRPIQITYSQEAKAAHIEGKMLLKCVITVDGSVVNCRVVKGLPMVTKEVLDAVSRSKFTPVLFQGRPVAVDLVIPISVVAG